MNYELTEQSIQYVFGNKKYKNGNKFVFDKRKKGEISSKLKIIFLISTKKGGWNSILLEDIFLII